MPLRHPVRLAQSSLGTLHVGAVVCLLTACPSIPQATPRGAADVSAAPERGQVPIRPLATEGPVGALLAGQTGLLAPERLVVRDSATWAALWQRIARPVLPPMPVPPVDFGRDVLVVAATGQVSEGWDVSVPMVTAYPDSLVAVVHVRSGRWPVCQADGGLAPVAVIRVPRDPRHVVFHETAAHRACRKP